MQVKKFFLGDFPKNNYHLCSFDGVFFHNVGLIDSVLLWVINIIQFH